MTNVQLSKTPGAWARGFAEAHVRQHGHTVTIERRD